MASVEVLSELIRYQEVEWKHGSPQGESPEIICLDAFSLCLNKVCLLAVTSSHTLMMRNILSCSGNEAVDPGFFDTSAMYRLTESLHCLCLPVCCCRIWFQFAEGSVWVTVMFPPFVFGLTGQRSQSGVEGWNIKLRCLSLGPTLEWHSSSSRCLSY